ncbi:GDP-fucose protein O-fucosyltransferase 2-like [Macrosteles quadrilineatus]|uniref:GDP-fucose protein O-fucosyltransferase 2-like n=1 Tax=Macrosteles quadrilineatus TaxID=74068 RepID=UPI0023E34F74|nr:GDP-fucose protein O-fucosyltransferase 2-like [Macrosteles quadrilineatus]XP_054288621.1 GDP-fucose protein O-fucosyltransferase 2-like [Macrosteles quadrilineatus]XP_054288622.1 GDP-fucose protein O-fucosyltransferase 2-like [Macrosteles quadrilineatus]
MYKIITLIFLIFTLTKCSDNSPKAKIRRYILYDVNPGEGFNLRRDVYMRMAIFIHNLSNKSEFDWHLVLPPWNKLWHWRNDLHASYQWNIFFDIPSLQLFAPVIELEDFISDYSKEIDEAYVLQHFPDFYSWTEGKEIDWSERWNYSECRNSHRNESDETFFFFDGRITTKHFRCISFHGTSGFLQSVVSSTNARAVMFDRAEIVTHMLYGDSDYWTCRRSMRFAKRLVEVASNYRAAHLNSSDVNDGTIRPVDFRDETPQRSAKGGPYLSVHLRRQEFKVGHPDAVPTIHETVQQIKKHLNDLGLNTVFVATDATEQEYIRIKSMLHADNLFAIRFLDTIPNNKTFKDAELAIIDQIIASHAKYFVGTYESTFTYRIQEEREVLGFLPETTFNRFCSTSIKENCVNPTKWLIEFPEDESRHSSHTINYRKSDEL